jgi:hypothetical protein
MNHTMASMAMINNNSLTLLANDEDINMFVRRVGYATRPD